MKFKSVNAMRSCPVFLLLSLMVALMSMSCASVSTMQTPGVVPQGEVRWAMSVSGAGGDVASSAAPNFEASVRYGLADSVDVGLKLSLLGAQVGAKYQFLQGDFDLAIGLEAGYQWVRTSSDEPINSHVLAFQLPIMMEYHFNPYVGLAFGPKLLGVYVAKTDERADIWGRSGFYAGLFVGLPLRLTEGIWFMPEINIYSNVYDEAKKSFSNVLWQASVSVFFGGLD